MKNKILTLAEIGVVYLAASIILDSLLSSYQILLWPALAIAFIFFATMIFDLLWEPGPRRSGKGMSEPASSGEDDLTRLKHLCKHVFEQGDITSENVLREKINSLAFAAISLRLNEPTAQLRMMAKEEPDTLQRMIGDEKMYTLLTTGPFIRKGDLRTVADGLTRIEEWIR